MEKYSKFIIAEAGVTEHIFFDCLEDGILGRLFQSFECGFEKTFVKKLTLLKNESLKSDISFKDEKVSGGLNHSGSHNNKSPTLLNFSGYSSSNSSSILLSNEENSQLASCTCSLNNPQSTNVALNCTLYSFIYIILIH